MRTSALLAAVSLVVVMPVQAPAQTAYDHVHHAVSTRSPAAQAAFDEGVTLLAAFNPGEAIRRFQTAAHDDPKLAMSYWGIALAYGPNINTDYSLSDAAQARGALAHAHRLAGNASEEERALITALDHRYAVRTTKDIDPAQHAYADAMAAVVKRYPNDDDVAAWYAESLMDLQPWDSWSPDGKPIGETPHIAEMLAGIMAHDPNHILANHLYIHIIEASPHPQDGLPSADRLHAMHFEPAAEHLVHMPAHIYDRVGDYQSAIAASDDAIAHFHTYLAHPRAPGHDGYLYHDASVLITAQMSAGMYHAAMTTAQSEPLVDDTTPALRVEERFHKWSPILNGTGPAPDAYAKALAYAETGDADRAAVWYAKLAAGDDQQKLARTIVQAEIAGARHDTANAIALLQQAVTQQDALGYGEPPEWYFPVREALGARLVEAGRFDEARRVFDTELQRDPGNPRALFGLCRSLEGAGASEQTKGSAVQAFKHAWANADGALTIEDLY